MNTLKRCPNCNGSKMVIGLGALEKKCPDCKGIGFVDKIEDKDVDAMLEQKGTDDQYYAANSEVNSVETDADKSNAEKNKEQGRVSSEKFGEDEYPLTSEAQAAALSSEKFGDKIDKRSREYRDSLKASKDGE